MNIEAIIFDIGGMLRERVPDKTFQTQASERLLLPNGLCLLKRSANTRNGP
jgi:hypothetical protein